MNAPPRKPGETAGDYLAVWACPGFIMTMVGSLVLLLLEASYSGPWLGSMRWTLCWFTLAIVLVSRIAIEQNRALALGYGAALGLATSAYLSSHFGFVLPVWILLGVVWWVADRLTWDCAMIDEEADSSGLGLMQAGKLDPSSTASASRVKMAGQAATPDPSIAPAREDGKRMAGGPPAGREPGGPARSAAQKVKRKGRKQELHAPGIWVLYFALGAVPLFGLGEILIPSKDPGGRLFAFWLLMVYLASAAVLLLLTSFLGLRRYLRQRWLPMPPAIAFSWVNSGAWLIVALLLTAFLLPRPATSYSLDRLVVQKQSAESGKEGPETAPEPKEGSRETPRAPAQPPGNKPQPGEGARPGRAPAREKLRLPAWGEWFSRLVAAIVLLVIILRFRAELWQALQDALAKFRSRAKGKSAASRFFHRAPAPAPPPGLRFPNPFQSGQAAAMPPEELLRYTFEAAKAWAALRGTRLEDHETPVEFAERFSLREPVLEREIRLLSRYYSHLAYAGQPPPPEAAALLQKLWGLMTFK